MELKVPIKVSFDEKKLKELVNKAKRDWCDNCPYYEAAKEKACASNLLSYSRCGDCPYYDSETGYCGRIDKLFGIEAKLHKDSKCMLISDDFMLVE